MRRRVVLPIRAASALCAMALATAASAQQISAESVAFFESRVRPILVEHCQKCHGHQKQWAGLRVDSREALLAGGDSGAAVIPGQPEESLLIRAVRHADNAPQMPENGQLTEQQIADLVEWVELGAPFPESRPAALQARDAPHWSFQPLMECPLPAVQNPAWCRTEIDYFVLHGLEEAGLTPAPAADKRTLIRRLSFDLTGLPPTPADIEAFLSDDRPDAYERLVDRLLASPAYGEHWGRHWLDVARYADSNGLDENIAHGNAWRYRDYVVASMNADKPFDRFIVEQLAGDLLEYGSQSQRHENLIATGLLAIGPKVLAEVNQSKMRMDIIDEQIDMVGRVLLGLTLGCARCHDHKFDPIDTEDYYALAGIFKSTRTMETYTKVARWHENLLPSAEATEMQARYDAELVAKKRAVENFIAQANRDLAAAESSGSTAQADLEAQYPEATKVQLAKLREELAALEKEPPALPAAMGVTEDPVVDVAIHIRGNPDKLGEVVPRRTPTVLQGPPLPQFTSAESGRRQLAEWLINPNHPLTARVLVNRVWNWHFGAGIVRSVDNFGLQGQPPTDPQLLDWLARRFIHDGWSLKSLHRLLVNSSTYRQSSQASGETLTADPENLLWGRIEVQRLSAEQVRDALLSVSGQLDLAMGGSLLQIKNRAYFFDHTSIDHTDYTSRRRSLYLPIVRNNVYDVFQLLDFPDPAVPTGQRTTTTVAPQALLMMNSELVMDAADQFAARLLQLPADNAKRLSYMALMAYGREISPNELRSHEAFLASIDQAVAPAEADELQRRRKCWSILCHTIFASNEFIYIR